MCVVIAISICAWSMCMFNFSCINSVMCCLCWPLCNWILCWPTHNPVFLSLNVCNHLYITFKFWLASQSQLCKVLQGFFVLCATHVVPWAVSAISMSWCQSWGRQVFQACWSRCISLQIFNCFAAIQISWSGFGVSASAGSQSCTSICRRSCWHKLCGLQQSLFSSCLGPRIAAACAT